MTIAATAIYSYAWLVPLALWGLLVWRNSKVMNIVSYSFLEIVCVYGYSLAVYIPAVVKHDTLHCFMSDYAAFFIFYEVQYCHIYFVGMQMLRICLFLSFKKKIMML